MKMKEMILLFLLSVIQTAVAQEERRKEVIFVVWTTTWGRVSEEYNVTCGSRFGGLKYFVTGNKELINKADGVIFHSPDTGFSFPHTRRHDQVWILRSMESAQNDKHVDRTISNPTLSLFNLTSTYDRKSDGWIPYMPSSIRSLMRPIVPAHERTKSAPIVWVSANCGTFSRREEFVKELSKHVKIDSFGSCNHNKDWDERVYGKGGNGTAFKELISHYKFYLALENTECRDYVTEKYWRTLQLGLIPIIWGTTDPEHDFEPSNSKSVIRVSDFETIEDLANYIKRIDSDDNLFKQYMTWKDEPKYPIKTFESVLSEKFLKVQKLARGECPLAQSVLNAIDKYRKTGTETHISPDTSCLETPSWLHLINHK